MGVSVSIAVVAAIRSSRAHEWFWLAAILVGWVLLGASGGLGWVVPAVYLFVRRRPRVPAEV